MAVPLPMVAASPQEVIFAMMSEKILILSKPGAREQLATVLNGRGRVQTTRFQPHNLEP
jgi:hypothetical protein